MARETLAELSAQLSGLLDDLDAAIAARLPESRRQRAVRQRRPLARIVAAALRWFGRGRPSEERSRRPA
jgi:hypothetical protein